MITDEQAERMATLVAELRSGTRNQGRNWLKRLNEFTEQWEYCCEGVASELAAKTLGFSVDMVDRQGHVVCSFDGQNQLMSKSVREYYGFEYDGSMCIIRFPEGQSPYDGTDAIGLVSLNDNYRLSLAQIGDLIEWYYLSGRTNA